MTTSTLSHADDVYALDGVCGYATVWGNATHPQWFTSDEFEPAVVVHDRADECPGCGTFTAGHGDCGRHEAES